MMFREIQTYLIGLGATDFGSVAWHSTEAKCTIWRELTQGDWDELEAFLARHDWHARCICGIGITRIYMRQVKK
jgi:hypothetical protein